MSKEDKQKRGGKNAKFNTKTTTRTRKSPTSQRRGCQEEKWFKNKHLSECVCDDMKEEGILFYYYTIIKAKVKCVYARMRTYNTLHYNHKLFLCDDFSSSFLAFPAKNVTKLRFFICRHIPFANHRHKLP